MHDVTLWGSLTAPQATIISSLVTVAGAVGAVWLGWTLFGGRVRDLKGAVEESSQLLNGHKTEVEGVLSEVRDRIAGLDAQFTTTIESLGQLRASVSDIQTSTVAESGTPQEGASREALSDNWNAIRDRVEQIAADRRVDGRTRARYARMDRRSYGDLIEALARDGRLGGVSDAYREALQIWMRYRNGRGRPTAADVRRLQELRVELADVQPVPMEPAR